jgi:anthranilate synthase component 2
MLVLLDNYDSFTFNLVDYFFRAGMEMKVLRNHEPLEAFKKLNPSGLVISPGPEVPEKAGQLMRVLEYYAGRIPVFGICLGHQAIGSLFGSRIIKAKEPRHGKISVLHVLHPNDVLFKGRTAMEVVRYHSLVLEQVPREFDLTALAVDDGSIQAMSHRVLPIHSVQFHPEAALTLHGKELIRNWVTGIYSMVS